LKSLKKTRRGDIGINNSVHVCINNMPSIKEKHARIKALFAVRISLETSGRKLNETEIRNLIEDYMINTWALGYVTRHDYLNIIFR